jgi:type I restriction enzyme, R subunit
MTITITEDTYAEQPALEWLAEGDGLLTWELGRGATIAPNGPAEERKRWEDVVLTSRLRGAVGDLNPGVPLKVIDDVVGRVVESASPIPIDDHAAFHEMLVVGVPYSYIDERGNEQSGRARIIDFDTPEQNDYLAVSQVTIVHGMKNRRVDILLFVNGLPLGEIELKSPKLVRSSDDRDAPAREAANQLAHYVSTIPQLYRFVEIVGVSDLFDARVGTITTPPEHFAEWKTMDAKESEGRSALEVMIRQVFSPRRFLDLIHNFVLFETDGSRTTKVLAKYHQYDAVTRAIEATARAMGDDGRAGVVWHTQGSGKSYTMVFYVGKLRRDPRFANPTVVAVTDRLDLDDQLEKTFAAQRDLAPAIKSADTIQDLHAYLQVPAGGIVFTTIQKFQPIDGDAMPLLSDRSNVVVIADEAHRSQYDTFAENITRALPRSTRIGFTGTPIEKEDRSTRLVFGDYISVYRMARSIEDGQTVPIFYESRSIPIAIRDESLMRDVEEILESEEEQAAGRLVTSWAKLERVVGTPDRLDRLADDIAQHYLERVDFLAGKAMVVGMSQRICAELTARLKQRLGDEAVTCVISAQATDEPQVSQYRRSRQERTQIETEFKDPDHRLRVVVVRDMWLTGFDVPSLHTLYVDKPMRDHGLMQAIARVNRVFRDKPGGLVVDYIGIADDLRASLSAYSDDIAAEAMIPLADAINKLSEKHDVVSEFFHGLNFRARHGMSPGERATLLVNAHAAVVADDETKRSFLKEYKLFARWLALVNPHPPALDFKDDVEFFGTVASNVMKYTPLDEQASIEARHAVSQFFAEGLAAGEVVDIFELAGEERPEVSVLSDEFLDDVSRRLGERELGVEVLKKLLRDEIQVRERVNHIQAKLFSDALSDLLARYANKQLTSAEVVKRLVELAKRMRELRRRHEKLGLSVEEAAFYDALAERPEDVTADPVIAEIARTLVQSIKADLSVDWADHEATEAAIRVKIKRILRRSKVFQDRARTGGGRGLDLNRLTDLLLDQARSLYRYWPDIFTTDLV